MNFFHHKDLGNHLLQLCPKVVKHPVYIQGVYECWNSSRKTEQTSNDQAFILYQGKSFRISAQLVSEKIFEPRPITTTPLHEWNCIWWSVTNTIRTERAPGGSLTPSSNSVTRHVTHGTWQGRDLKWGERSQMYLYMCKPCGVVCSKSAQMAYVFVTIEAT